MLKSMCASLYVPTNHPHLLAIANGERVREARSLIFCTEDSVSDRELSWALFNLSVVLQNMRDDIPADRFVRVRNADVLARVLAMPGVDKLRDFLQSESAKFRKVIDAAGVKVD